MISQSTQILAGGFDSDSDSIVATVSPGSRPEFLKLPNLQRGRFPGSDWPLHTFVTINLLPDFIGGRTANYPDPENFGARLIVH
jgi:hypothetical protein